MCREACSFEMFGLSNKKERQTFARSVMTASLVRSLHSWETVSKPGADQARKSQVRGPHPLQKLPSRSEFEQT